MKKTYVWSLPTRLFHWLLAIAFVAAFVLGENDDYLNLHTAFGYMVGVLLLFRVVWGFIGPRYSRFRDFSFLSKTKNNNPGHNTTASWIMLAIIIVGLLVVISGMITLSEGAAWLSFMPAVDGAKEWHEAFVKIMLALVVIHLLGVAADRIRFGKNGTFASIFSGSKNMEAEGVKITRGQSLFSFIWILAAIVALMSAILWQDIQAHGKHAERYTHEEHRD